MSKLVSVRINDLNQKNIEYIQRFYKRETGFELPISVMINLGLELYCYKIIDQINDHISKEREEVINTFFNDTEEAGE